MQLQESQFTAEEINKHGQSAGVVPWALDDEGRVQILLGRERFVPSWRGSCRWSGFEGTRKADESIKETAVREFLEESLGVIMTKSEVTRVIYREQATLHIVIRMVSERSVRYHSTYVVRIPWERDINKRFRTTRAHLEYIDRLIQEWKYCRPSALGAFPEEIGPITCEAGSQHVTRTTRSMPCIVRPPWKLRDDSRMDAVFENPDIEEWSILRDRITRAQIEHPSITLKRDASFGLIQDASLCQDYLEKDYVRWWGLDDLVDIMAKHGQRGSERFRPFFLPVVQLCIEELKMFESVQSSTSPPAEPAARELPTEHTPPDESPTGA
jgi:hypothetical protein